jgi:hypothetical protein
MLHALDIHITLCYMECKLATCDATSHLAISWTDFFSDDIVTTLHCAWTQIKGTASCVEKLSGYGPCTLMDPEFQEHLFSYFENFILFCAHLIARDLHGWAGLCGSTVWVVVAMASGQDIGLFGFFLHTLILNLCSAF